MAYKLDTKNKRGKLKIRNEPYWDVLGSGKSLGYRVSKRGNIWKARYKTIYKTLGGTDLYIEDDPKAFDKAKAAAEEWYLTVSVAGNHRYTVAAAIDDYLEDLATRKSKRSVYDTQTRLNKHLTPALKATLLTDLKTIQIERWHRSMVTISDDPEVQRKSKDSANRTLTSFKAALNKAFNSKEGLSDSAWRKVKPFQKVNAARKLFLTDEQLQRLLSASEGAFKDLITAAILTGARYGELANAKVEDFDKSGTLYLSGKTGERTVILSSGAALFFKKLAANKLPKADLLSKDDGTKWGDSHQSRPWKATRIAARLPDDAVFYSLRHYHISKALLSGMPTQAVAENCGTSLRMIETHYAKFLNSDKQEMMNKIELSI